VSVWTSGASGLKVGALTQNQKKLDGSSFGGGIQTKPITAGGGGGGSGGQWGGGAVKS